MAWRDCLQLYSCDSSRYPPIGRGAIWTLYLVIFVDFFQLTFVYPFIPTLVASFGGQEQLVSQRVATLSSVAAFVETIANPILGSISDYFGRKPVMLVSTVGSAASAALLGFSHSFEVALVARILNSLSGGTASVANTYMADVTGKEERADYMAKITSLIGIGIAAGPIVGGYLYNLGGIEVACLSAAGISLFNFVCVGLFLQESSQHARACRRPTVAAHLADGAGEAAALEASGTTAATSASRTPSAPSAAPPQRAKLPPMIWVLFTANLFVSPLSVIFDTFANLYVTDLFYDGDHKQGTALFSQCVACIGVCLVVIPMLIYQPFKKCVGFNGTIIFGAMTIVTGLVGNGLAKTPVQFLGSTLLWATGFQLMGPAISVLITRLAPPTAFGRAFGLYMSFGNISRVIGPTALAPLYSLRHEYIFFVMAFSISIMALILVSVSVVTHPAREDVAMNERALDDCEVQENDDPGSPFLTRQLSRSTSTSAMMYGNLPGQLHLQQPSRRLSRATTDEHLSRRLADDGAGRLQDAHRSRTAHI